VSKCVQKQVRIIELIAKDVSRVGLEDFQHFGFELRAFEMDDVGVF